MIDTDSAWLVLYGIVAAYFCGHFACYWVIVRRRKGLVSERFILLYHLVPATVFGLVALGIAFAVGGEGPAAAALAAIFAHGIYSLTFLELWTLSQISYSREVLALAATVTGTTRDAAIRELAGIGDRKKAGRLESLEKLGLVRQNSDTFRLTCSGRLVSLFLSCLRWPTDIRSPG